MNNRDILLILYHYDDDNDDVACVAWRFWLLSNNGGRGQRNRVRISRLRRSCARLDKTAMPQSPRGFSALARLY